jgi:ethylbenzene dioxygenase ferredoxin subunit
MEKVVVCEKKDVVEDEPFSANPEGFPALAVYLVDGEYFVTDNICTHGAALLTDGYQEGEEIECPFHGGAFNIKTGEPTAFPCQTAINTYPVTLDGDQIKIEGLVK